MLDADASVVPAFAMPGLVVELDQLNHVALAADREVGAHRATGRGVRIAQPVHEVVDARTAIGDMDDDQVDR